MGNWNINISGVGAHHNKLAIDADQIYKRFVEELQAAGHNIVHSSITVGSAYYDIAQIPPVKNDVRGELDRMLNSVIEPEDLLLKDIESIA